jgi:hypothetical protein
LVTALFNRLGNLGLLLIAAALLFGGLAGAALVHHYETLSVSNVASQQDNNDEKKPATPNQHSHQKRANQGHQTHGQGNDPAETN